MTGQTSFPNARPYSIKEIPKCNIDYRGLIKYARSKGKPVIELSDEEKNRFIKGSTMAEIRRKRTKLEM